MASLRTGSLGICRQHARAPQGTEQGGIDNGAYGGFFTSPGYAFRRDEGLKAIDRGAAASGRPSFRRVGQSRATLWRGIGGERI
jgi:hypothetical protein